MEATCATRILRALFHKLLPKGPLSAVWNMITGYPYSPKVFQFNLDLSLQQHISSIAPATHWDGFTNLPCSQIGYFTNSQSCKGPWSNIHSPYSWGSTSQSYEASSATAQSFLAWNPSHGSSCWVCIHPVCNLGTPYSSLCSKQTRPLFLTLTWVTLLITKFLLGICWSFPNDPLLKVQIRYHLLPRVFLHSARTACVLPNYHCSFL